MPFQQVTDPMGSAEAAHASKTDAVKTTYMWGRWLRNFVITPLVAVLVTLVVSGTATLNSQTALNEARLVLPTHEQSALATYTDVAGGAVDVSFPTWQFPSGYSADKTWAFVASNGATELHYLGAPAFDVAAQETTVQIPASAVAAPGSYSFMLVMNVTNGTHNVQVRVSLGAPYVRAP